MEWNSFHYIIFLFGSCLECLTDHFYVYIQPILPRIIWFLSFHHLMLARQSVRQSVNQSRLAIRFSFHPPTHPYIHSSSPTYISIRLSFHPSIHPFYSIPFHSHQSLNRTCRFETQQSPQYIYIYIYRKSTIASPQSAAPP